MEVCVYHALDSINEMCRKTPDVTLRDMFAMNALNGILACGDFHGSEEQYAIEAYAFADAMIKARKIK